MCDEWLGPLRPIEGSLYTAFDNIWQFMRAQKGLAVPCWKD